jgi:N utilization substance protein A
MTKSPEEILAAEAAEAGEAEQIDGLSSEDIADAEDRISESDANDDNDAREEQIELENDSVDQLVAESEEVSSEGAEDDPGDRA